MNVQIFITAVFVVVLAVLGLRNVLVNRRFWEKCEGRDPLEDVLIRENLELSQQFEESLNELDAVNAECHDLYLKNEILSVRVMNLEHEVKRLKSRLKE